MRNSTSRYEFTPAAARALSAAAKWMDGDDLSAISPTELLLGLLDESESRAAEMLLARGVDTPAVLNRWPGKVQSPRQRVQSPGQKVQSPKSKVQSQDNGNGLSSAVLSPELQSALAEASLRLADFPRPLQLATEHLLLGLVTAGDELAGWLGEQGFDPDALAGEICRLYGYGEGSGADQGSGVRVQGSGDDALHTGSAGNGLGGLPERLEVAPVASPPSVTEGVPNKISAPQDVRCRATESGDCTALLRILDAAANRAREGLRVLEDYVRFTWNDRYLTSQLKLLRHELASALALLPADELLASRNTLADVGTTVSTAGERHRPDMESVVAANAKRLQESLRSIEEYGKIVSPQLSAEIEQLRYRSYTLERALAATSLGLRRLAEARLYVLVDGRASLPAFRELVQTLVAAGVDVLQLRDKQLADGELLERARLLSELTSGTRTLFIMNDRPDLAALSQADGVHVGQEELSVAACREIVGPRALVGVSTHSLEQARQAVLDGANYIGVGPTFPSQTKPFASHALRGPELLRAIQGEICLPAFAIGGIDRQNLGEVLAAGVLRVAVSGAILSADDPGQTARELATRLAGAVPLRPYISRNP